MKIDMIGHASIFVETQDCRFLMDPVLWDPHQEGLFDVCPKREVLLNKLPDFEVLIISHKHLDHFDIRSLAHLPKNVEVIIPKDSLIERSLKKLGYRKIYPLGDFRELNIGATKLFTTRSENRVPEFGIIFSDESGVFWNCVDTAIESSTIKKVLEMYRQIDFLLATWQPMLESNYQSNQSLVFPYYGYGQQLYNISLINPQAVAPGANAFRYIDGGEWLNKIVFPVTREQFCHDVLQACPHLQDNIFPFNPGDRLEFYQSQFNYQSQGCEYVKIVEDNRESVDFSPVNLTKLVDLNPRGYDCQIMEETLQLTISIDLHNYLQENLYNLFQEYQFWQVIYQLEIVFPEKSEKWFFDFANPQAGIQKGRHPRANLFTYITASGLYGILQNDNGWDYVGLGGYHRSFNKIYQVNRYGINVPHYTQFFDPLLAKYCSDDLEITMRDREVEQWQQEESEIPILTPKVSLKSSSSLWNLSPQLTV
jgi:hypothetical protein